MCPACQRRGRKTGNGRCEELRGLDSSTFFHPENERGPSRVRRERAAKQVCASCPVTQACLSWALRTREPYGVWGGKSTEERAQLIRARAS